MLIISSLMAHLLLTENITKCDPAHPDQITTGTWTLLEDGKKITIDPIDEEPADTGY